MSGKSDKHFSFEVNLNWIDDTRGVLAAKDANGTVHVATPPEFGGSGRPWTPEHLFLASISSCFMTTYLAFTKKLRFHFSNFECNSIGQVEIIDGKYKFTHIDLYPKVFINDETLREKANLALEKTHKHCLVSNSINAIIYYHSQVLLQTGGHHGTIAPQLKKATGSYDLDEYKKGA